jgi:alkaline phosphatase D
MKISASVLFLMILLASCKEQPQVTKIAFGSCGYQDEPQPVLGIAAEQKPDAFIFLGDNIYGDTDNMDTLRNKYQRLGAKLEYQHLG